MSENSLKKAVLKSRASAAEAEVMSTELKKSKVITLRVEEPLFKAIEAQAELWNVKPAETIRRVLRFYFLPVALELELRGESEKFWKGEFTPEAVGEYMVFLLETTEKIRSSALFLSREAVKLSEATEGKLSEALEEEREGAET
jgi:hypothetical protein